MDVILLSDVDKVGLRGEVVSVARGYARNYLLPRRLAEPATPGRVAEIARIEAQRARKEARTADEARQIAGVLAAAELRFDVRSGPTGSLFGSVTTTDIADRIWEQHKIRVDRKKIGTDSIRRIGRYSIPIALFEDVSVEVKTLVVPEGGELPPEEELAAMEAAEAAAAEAESGGPDEPAADSDLDETDGGDAQPTGSDRDEPQDEPAPLSTDEPAEGGDETVDGDLDPEADERQ